MALSPSTAATCLDDPRWQAVVNRDPAADAQFLYGVTTTGVFCRPSCPSRLAKPQHVRFFATSELARAEGFRACRRCQPDAASPSNQHAKLIAQACRTIETADEPPRLNQLAEAAGLSPHHFHRLFKRITGVTPRAYAASCRAQKLRENLAGGRETVTRAIFEAGFNASSRLYEQADAVLGMSPGTYRRGGQDTRICFAVGPCLLGQVLVAQSAKGVCAILLGDDPDHLLQDLQRRFPRAELIGGDAAFERTAAAVIAFIDAPQLGFGLPLDIRGTAFQQRVWSALQTIPAGTTVSYAELARRIGQPDAVRAVAGACAANAIAVAIPCHRVVRTDGSLSGYRWGLERKQALIGREAEATTEPNPMFQSQRSKVP